MNTKNIIVCGLGGQGVIFASTILTNILLACTSFDIKTSEIHGISQRGGSVFVEIRIGDIIYSPIISLKSTNYLLDLSGTEYLNYLPKLSSSCVIIKRSNDYITNSELEYEFEEINIDSFLNAYHLDIKSSNMILLSSLLRYLNFNYLTVKTALMNTPIGDSNLKALLVMLKK